MANDRFLLCRAGTRIVALGLQNVLETLRPLPVQPLADLPGCVLGVALLRGIPTPVIDLDRVLGESSSSIARFVSLNVGGRSMALAVDEVIEVRAIPAQMLTEVPTLLGEANATIISAVGSLDASLLLLLESSRLVPDSVWTSVDTLRLSA